MGIFHRYSKMKNFILAILISNVSTVFLIEKRSEHLVQDQAGKFEVDLPSDFGERIRKRINEIRLCHNAFDSGTAVSDRCLTHTTRDLRTTKKTSKRALMKKRFHFKKIKNFLTRKFRKFG